MALMLRLPEKTPDTAPRGSAPPTPRFPAWSPLRQASAERREAMRRSRGGLA